jgi:hypothetical protein
LLTKKPRRGAKTRRATTVPGARKLEREEQALHALPEPLQMRHRAADTGRLRALRANWKHGRLRTNRPERKYALSRSELVSDKPIFRP